VSKQSTGERIASLEATIREREKYTEKQWSELHTLLNEIKNLFQAFNEKCNKRHEDIDKRMDANEKRTDKLCAAELTRREKLKIYGAITAGAIPGILAVVAQLLR
jgi:hypothetical protein